MNLSEQDANFEAIQEPIEENTVIDDISSPEPEIVPQKEKEEDKTANSHFDSFYAEVEKETAIEAKLQKTIDFMEMSLSKSGTPHFKSFWMARSYCMKLFKENISPGLRAHLWSKFIQLTKEAEELKKMLDEQSSFAAEQIDIAIQAAERDIDNVQEVIEAFTGIEIEAAIPLIDERLDYYVLLQKELSFLNTVAARINALRKELIKTDMRIRLKNKLFQRLSVAGDKVFPRRKELIREVSDSFMADINEYIQAKFKGEFLEGPLFTLRDEIKALQNLAKQLTLNTQSFTHTRMCLSECWDQLRGLEKEKKKERAQQRVAFKQNFDEVHEKIEACAKAFEANELTKDQALNALDEISQFMRSVELGRDEVKQLREELANVRKPIFDKEKADQMARQEAERQKEQIKRQKVIELKEEGEAFIAKASELDIESLLAEKELFLQKIQQAGLNRLDKQDIDKILKPLKDIILDKKEQSLLSLSDDQRQAHQQLKEVLNQRLERRREIKQLLDEYRKALGGSGLDFTQAMQLNSQVAEEKERLEKINQGIQEIEEKIGELEG